MSTEELHSVARQFVEDIWGRGDLAAAERLIAADCTDHMPGPGQRPGRDGHLDVLGMVRGAFPDAAFTLDNTVAEGDRVTANWTMTATHTGPFFGVPPTGRPVVLRGIDILRVADGRITDFWHVEDILGVLMQLGVVPPPQ